MDTDPDSELLQRYVKGGSEEAFDELVQRHLDVVYGVVLRKVDGDAELAKDVTQDLFRDLARRAGRLVSHPSLIGWLFVGARYYASNCRRAEHRRRVREAKAAEMEATDMTHSSSDDHREDLYPALEDALAKLKDKDRQAILLRFFERRSFPEVGKHLGLSEDAARMRVDRAIEKLGGRLRRQGVTSGTAGVLALLNAKDVGAAPVGLGSRISQAVLHGAGPSVEIPFSAKLMTGAPWKAIAGGLIGAAAVALVVSFNRSDVDAPSLDTPKFTAVGNVGGNGTSVQPAPEEKPEGATAGNRLSATGLASEPDEPGDLRLALITATDEKPIEHGRIEYRIWTEGDFQSGDTASNDNGVCKLDLPPQLHRIELTTRIEGYADTRLEWRPERGEVIPDRYQLELEEAVPIGGRVVGPDGNPVAGATVGFNHDNRPSEAERPESHHFGYVEVKTDDKGRWRIKRIADEMIAQLRGGAEHPEHYRSAHRSVRRVPKAEKELRNESFTFHLRRAVTARGRVTAPNGYPIADADVLIGHLGQASSRQGVTDAKGRFEIKGCEPAKRLVTAEAEGYAPTTRRIDLAEKPDSIELLLKQGRPLRLRVVDPDSDPIHGATVSVSPLAPIRTDFSEPKPVPVQTEFSRKTDDEGHIVWRNAPDTAITFGANAPGYMGSGRLQFRPDGEEHVITLKPELAIHGTVTDAVTGKPIPKFRIVCGHPRRGPDGAIRPEWSSLERFWLDFAEGTFQHTFDELVIRGTGNPAYIFKFQADGYAPYISRVVDADERTARMDVELEPGSATRLRIRTPNGESAIKASVGLLGTANHLDLLPPNILSDSGGAVRSANEKGEIDLYPDETLQRLVVVHRSGFAEIGSGRLQDPLVIGLQEWGHIDGVLLDLQGEPLQGRTVLLRFADRKERTIWLHSNPNQPESDNDYQTKTDDDGQFSFRFVPPGHLELLTATEWTRTDGGMSRKIRDSMTIRMEAGEQRRLKWQSEPEGGSGQSE